MKQSQIPSWAELAPVQRQLIYCYSAKGIEFGLNPVSQTHFLLLLFIKKKNKIIRGNRWEGSFCVFAFLELERNGNSTKTTVGVDSKRRLRPLPTPHRKLKVTSRGSDHHLLTTTKYNVLSNNKYIHNIDTNNNNNNGILN